MWVYVVDNELGFQEIGPQRQLIYVLNKKDGKAKKVDIGKDPIYGRFNNSPIWFFPMINGDKTLLAIVSGADGFLRIFDADSHKMLWTLGLGSIDGAAIVRFDEKFILNVLNSDMENNKWITKLVITSDPPSVRSINIHGSIKVGGIPAENVPVIVGGKLTKTDQFGNFSIDLNAQGKILLTAGSFTCEKEQSWNGFYDKNMVDITDGKHSYEVNIDDFHNALSCDED